MTEKTPRPSTVPLRSLLVHLPLPLANALDLIKVRRQQAHGRLITKKSLVTEAVQQFVTANE
jgi:hypothetical protein